MRAVVRKNPFVGGGATNLVPVFFLVTLCLVALPLVAAGIVAATRVDIASQPVGASVRINHEERGVTPLTVMGLPEQPCLVQLVKPGFHDVFATVTPEPGELRVLSLKLSRQMGLLLLVTDPPDCEVESATVSLGRTPLLVTTLPSGTHKLRLSAPGYQPKEIEVELDGRLPVKREVALLSDSGMLVVSSQPEGAQVFVNGISRGHTPCRVDRIPGGTFNLALEAAGYEKHSREISLAAGETHTLNVELQPLPAMLRVVSIPDKARVYFNNEFKGETPLELGGLAPGRCRVRVDLGGYDSQARDILLARGTSATEEFRLIKNSGRLEVVTAPAGATILLNSRKAGVTLTGPGGASAVSEPCAIEDVAEGEHEVEVFRKGFATQKRRVVIKRGETQALQIALRRLFIPDYEVVTPRSHFKGVLKFVSEEGIQIETAPGVSQTIPMKDVKRHGYLREDGEQDTPTP